MPFAASDLYPPLNLDTFWPFAGCGIFIAAIGGYYLLHWLRIRLALHRQQRLTRLSKPNKEAIIAKALQEIERVQKDVAAEKITTDAGAEQISRTTRIAFDELMNHRTTYAAKYEIAARNLKLLVNMLDVNYPVAFDPLRDKANFPEVCDTAVKVINACR